MEQFTFDPNKATEVKTIFERKGGQNYDMAFSTKTKRFRLSKNAVDRLGISNNGFKMVVQDGRPLLVIVPEGEASMFGRRHDKKTGEPKKKGDEAANPKLRTYLEESLGSDIVNYGLRSVGKMNGRPVLLVEKYDEAKGSSLEFVGGQASANNSNGATKEAPKEAVQEKAPEADPNSALFDEPAATEEAVAEPVAETAPADDPFAD